jgi:two-component system, NarL family, sensor histidine kinase DevS
MVAVFALYPRQLFRSHAPLAIMAAVTTAWWLLDTAHLAFSPQIGSYLPVMVLTAGIFGLIAVQAWVNRSDPRARAALRWLGLSVFVGISGYVFGNALPILLGDTPALPQGLLLGSFLLIYVGLALGIGRYRLFQLDQWAYRTVFYTSGALAVLAADAALIFALQIERFAALGVALLLIGLLYLPLRDTLWRRLTARRRTSSEDLFGWVMETALAGQHAEREARWRDLMVRLFEPLEVEPAAVSVADPAILDDGLEMTIPATAASPALRLRFARSGRSLFRSEDLGLARQAVNLMRQAEASREAYERGAAEERRRIAQDLHDDVGTRLLSGLHKPDLPQTRSALREAIADIRMVVGGLAGDTRPLDHVLADLRHEAAERLAGAGILLVWPLTDEDEEIRVDYVVQKALRSAMREMVSNTIRHSGATQMTVDVERSGSALRLVVQDDGVGLPETLPTGERQGFGLLGLVDRMETLGGSITLPKVSKGMMLDLTFNLSGRKAGTVAL